MKHKLLLFALVLFSLALPRPALADGIIIPEPPVCLDRPCPPPPCPLPGPCPPRPSMEQLEIRYHHVTVTIQDQVAVTHVDQVFHNPNDWAVEGTYTFPLPAEAAVSAFKLWIDGEPVLGKVLDAQEARQAYEEIVRSLRDPALLEYAGRGAVQASIFPIPPGGDRRIELEYSQALPAENGLVHYVYPLNTEKFSSQPLESVTVQVQIASASPIRAVYSPSHEVGISREDPNHVKVGYEAANVLPDADFSLYYSLGEAQAFHLLAARDPSDPADPDGFFLLLLAPRPDAAAQTLPKDVILVLDRSGSMQGEKFQQAQEALRYILAHLNPEDRFDLISFSTGVETYAPGLRPASESAEAVSWVDRLSAEGSTDINRALLEAAALASQAGDERPTYLIFLTDGLPTEGETDSQRILNNLAGAAPQDLRLFAFGVGYDVDTFLLDSLAQAHHGSSTYVPPGERLDETLSAFYARISAPVLTGLSLDFGGLAVYDLYPSPLPDLFAGSQIVVAGRYRAGGAADVTLTGMVNGQTQTFTFPGQVFPEQSEINNQQSAISRLWATRKIGYLLNQVRLNGVNQETVDQIVRLSIRYGIVTPYTSYLVTEPMPLGEAGQDRIAAEQYSQLEAQAAAPASGQAAVEKAAGQGALSAAEAPAAASAPGSENLLRIAGGRTFVLSGGAWVDTAYDPQKSKAIQVPFLSKDYFTLAKSSPELAAAFALGEKVIAFSGGKFYEVVEDGASQPVQSIPTTPAPLPLGSPAPALPDAVLSATPTPLLPFSPAPKSSSGLPCAGGLLPAVLISLAGFLVIKRR